jgi:heterotetrameric sarcosine oxidase gamma subunit
VVNLIALSPCDGLLPLSVGGLELAEVPQAQIFSVAPFKGQERAVSAKLKDQIGMGLSAPNRTTGKGAQAVQWFGHGVWLVTADVDLNGLAAVTNQSDGWAIVRISGAGVENVLARLVPVDLRAAVFKNGHTARTMLGHMTVSVTRTGANAFEILAMRSMAGTLVHELETAMRGVTAR